jgi:hypothetical protein
MRTTIIILIVFFLTTGSVKSYTITGKYNGPVNKFSMIDNNFAYYLGVRGGIILDDDYGIGGASYILVNRIRPPVPLGNELFIVNDYGGLLLEYFINDLPAFISASLLIGFGNFNYVKDNIQRNPVDTSIIFVLEPEFNAVFVISDNYRITSGLGFRIVNGVDVAGLSDKDVGKLTINIALQIGRY